MLMVVEKAYEEHPECSMYVIAQVLQGPDFCGDKLCESCSWAQQLHSDPGAVSCPMGSGLEAVPKDTVLW